MKKSQEFNNGATSYLSSPFPMKDGVKPSFVEHIAENYPVAALALAREMLTTDAAFIVHPEKTSQESQYSEWYEKNEEQTQARHLLLRITDHHPLLALPLNIYVFSNTHWSEVHDGIETAIDHCVRVYPEETAEILKKSIIPLRYHEELQLRLYEFLLETGVDIDEKMKQDMENKRILVYGSPSF